MHWGLPSPPLPIVTNIIHSTPLPTTVVIPCSLILIQLVLGPNLFLSHSASPTAPEHLHRTHSFKRLTPSLYAVLSLCPSRVFFPWYGRAIHWGSSPVREGCAFSSLERLVPSSRSWHLVTGDGESPVNPPLSIVVMFPHA